MPSNRPSRYNRSSIQRNNEATIARQDAALVLRRLGLSYIEIARRLGYTPNGVPRPQSAAEAVRAAERREALSLTQGAVASVAQNNTVASSVVTNAVANTVMSNRTFGVEVEFFGITANRAVEALTNAGLVAQRESYNHHVVPHWKFVTDASVTGRGTGLGSGLEMVSPILQGAQGLEDLAKAVKALLDAGAKVDRSCGVHVHIGADGMTGADIMRIIELYTQNNTHIDTVLAQSRHNASFAQKWSNATIANARSVLVNARSVNDIQSAVRNFGRYYTVNVTSYARQGTLEFRQHQGTVNPEKVVSWVNLLLAMMEKANAFSDSDVQDFGSLGGLMTAMELDDTTKAFLTRRANSLAGSR